MPNILQHQGKEVFKAIAKYTYLFTTLLLGMLSSCKEVNRTVDSKYVYHEPDYDETQIRPTQDTLTFPLTDYTYNAIRSFNVFSSAGTEYISFHDKRSESVNIYELLSARLVKRLSLKRCFADQRLYKTSSYIRNFDSIFVTNQDALHLLDSSGAIKRTIDFLERPVLARVIFENTNPPLFINNRLYVGVTPKINETSLKAMKRWQVLCGFDLTTGKASLYYHLPKIYQHNLFGNRFLNFAYCSNGQNNIVFSFAADTNIYETDLTDHHIAYYGKSRFQKGDIRPVAKESLLKNEGSRQYATRDAYGAVFFDPHKKRYLRIAKQKISEADYLAQKRARKQSLILLDEQFKIIGESEMSAGISLQSIFFSRDGSIYARVKATDEYNLHFVRLIYYESSMEKRQLTKNEKEGKY